MILETLSSDPVRVLAANSSSADFTTPIVNVITSPTAAGYVRLRKPNNPVAPNGVKLWFFGTGADDTTFDVRIYGVNRIERKVRPASTEPPHDLYFHWLLADLTCTLSTVVGIANSPVVAAERFADTITINDGNANVGLEVVSPAENMAAHVILDTKGAEFLFFDWDMTGATDANALIGEI